MLVESLSFTSRLFYSSLREFLQLPDVVSSSVVKWFTVSLLKPSSLEVIYTTTSSVSSWIPSLESN